jgi:3-methyladenine DNA glycosylase/8-oxoguanine DNA glycosylase
MAPAARPSAGSGPNGSPPPSRCTISRVIELFREWQPSGPLDVHLTLAPLRRGGSDPTYRVDADGSVWRAARTPAGPGTLLVLPRPAHGAVAARAWGPGAAWLLEQLPDWMGARDDVSGFEPRHPALRALHARRAGFRVTRTGLVLDSLVPTVLEQKVVGLEAHRSWRGLVWRFGEPAPAPPSGPALRVAPDPDRWTRIPSWEWRLAGVDDARSATVIRACRVWRRLEETIAFDRVDAFRRLCAVPGIGPWTAAETMQRAHGDADAVSVGDYNLPGVVGQVLAGHPVDDAGMLDLLEPYRGHRYRVTRLAELSGIQPQRRGPRARLRVPPARGRE